MKKHKKKDMPRIGFELTRSKTRDLGFFLPLLPMLLFLSLQFLAVRLGGHLWREIGTSHSSGSKQN